MSLMKLMSGCMHGNWSEHPVRCPSFETPL